VGEGVVFDVTCLARPALTGVGNYALNLAKALTAVGCKLQFVFKGSRLGAAKKIKQWLPAPSSHYFPGVSDVCLRSADIFHGPDFRLICSKRWHRVVTLHDLAVFHSSYSDPEFSSFAQKKLENTLRSQPETIVMDSDYCANELLNRFPEVEGRVKVVGLGSDRLLGVAPESIEVKEPYFLYVGTIEARKNVVGLVRAFKALVKKHPEYTLVCVGGQGYGAEQALGEMKPLEASGQLKRVGFVSDAQLVFLYQNALGLVYPSFYEGFGLPIMEAMALGCPVITSSEGAMAEVSGGCAELVDPNNDGQITEAMETFVLKSPQAMIQKAKAHAQQHTWVDSAKKMMEVYESMR